MALEHDHLRPLIDAFYRRVRADDRLGPIFEEIRRRAPSARLAVKPMPGVEHLVAAEAGADVEITSPDLQACAEAIADMCGRRGGSP